MLGLMTLVILWIQENTTYWKWVGAIVQYEGSLTFEKEGNTFDKRRAIQSLGFVVFKRLFERDASQWLELNQMK